ncbi:LysE/ArgO family amino acid transporter [Bifidobacterium aquikefiri]|uniref:LysE/ArgO family amino acid transporter n=1 Tax=Bifidobacterium aquikefiri TaxID=1653207 RepID=UPI0039E91E7C
MSSLVLSILIAGFTSQAGIIVAVGAQNAFIIRQGIARAYVPQILTICIGADIVLISLGTAGMGSMVSAHPEVMKALTLVGAFVLLIYGFSAFKRVFETCVRLESRFKLRKARALALAGGASVDEHDLNDSHSGVDDGDVVDSMATQPASSLRGSASASIAGEVESSANEFQKGAQTTLKKSLVACLGFTFLNPGVYLDSLVLLGGIAASYGAGLKWSFAAGAMLCSVVWFISLGFLSSKMSKLFKNEYAWLVLDTIIGIMMIFIAAHLALR